MKKVEHALEVIIFNSRWLLAPFYVGLVLGIILVLVKFVQEFLHLVWPLYRLIEIPEGELILAVLTLVDMSLVANLLLIIVFSGYENFVSKINTAGHEDRPEWMGKVDFSGLKVKVIASIVAISAVELLKSFINVTALPAEQLAWNGALGWKVIIHVILVMSGVLFATMDKIAESTGHHRAGKEE
jgi:uncharacterized protein (TIGR00645 family)